MNRLKILKLNNNGPFVSILNEECSYLQGFCDEIGLELLTNSRIYSPKINIFDYARNPNIMPDIFEKLLKSKKDSSYLPDISQKVMKKYENALEDYNFTKKEKIIIGNEVTTKEVLTIKAKVLLKILENNEKGIKEFTVEDLL